MERVAPTLFLPCEDKALAFICALFGLHFNFPLPQRRKFEAKGHLARPWKLMTEWQCMASFDCPLTPVSQLRTSSGAYMTGRLGGGRTLWRSCLGMLVS